jgi:UDP-N-acetylmuramyl pentapeptide phosphotransferase/UDP-N-acetylglucosamine-1-phosphate transferase
VIRVSKGKSPFTADRNHLHHLFLDMGMTHRVASSILYLINISYIILAFACSHLMVVSHLIIIFFSGILVLNLIPSFALWLIRRKLPAIPENTPSVQDVEVGQS